MFEPAEWSERPTPGQLGWLGAAAVGSIPALDLLSSNVYIFLSFFNVCISAYTFGALGLRSSVVDVCGTF